MLVCFGFCLRASFWDVHGLRSAARHTLLPTLLLLVALLTFAAI